MERQSHADGLGGLDAQLTLYNLAGDIDVVVDVAGWFDGDGPSTSSTACIVVTPAPPPPPPPPTTQPPTTQPPPPPTGFGDGTYLVGQQIAAGRYQAAGGSGCYWERLSGFGGTLDEIIANDFDTTGPIVSIAASDVGFNSHACGTWTRLGA